MFKLNNNTILLIISSLLLFFHGCIKIPSDHRKFDVVELSKRICKYFSVNDKHIYTINDEYCKFEDSLIQDYNMCTPLLPAINSSIILIKRLGAVNSYNLNFEELKKLTFDQQIKNRNRIIKYFHKGILYVDNEENHISYFLERDSIFVEEYSTMIPDSSIFNIYGGIKSQKVLIEAGYFPSGGCEYLKYYSLDLNTYELSDITEKILPINPMPSPFDIYNIDITQEYFFFPNIDQVRGFTWEPQDDYILNANFDTVGRALHKRAQEVGYSINKTDEIDFYYYKIGDYKLVCFPLNLNFEQLIFKTYYDSLLTAKEIANLSEIETKLLKSTILLKNNAIINDSQINDILSIYDFYYNYKQLIEADSVINSLERIEKKNFELLEN